MDAQGTTVQSTPAAAQTVKFVAGDVAVHPAHGVGEVLGLETRELNGKKMNFYVVKITHTGMKAMVALESVKAVGLRHVMTKKEAIKVIDILRSPEVAVDVQPWARRHRIYTEMLKTGSPYEIAKVLRDMSRLKFDKDLSFGERRLLDQAKALLISELALAKKITREQMDVEIKSILSS